MTSVLDGDAFEQFEDVEPASVLAAPSGLDEKAPPAQEKAPAATEPDISASLVMAGSVMSLDGDAFEAFGDDAPMTYQTPASPPPAAAGSGAGAAASASSSTDARLESMRSPRGPSGESGGARGPPPPLHRMSSAFGDIKSLPMDLEAQRKLVQEALTPISGATDVRSATIAQVLLVGDVVFYSVAVASHHGLRWTLRKRFKEFEELNDAVEARVRVSYALPPFPDKKWKLTTNHASENFIEARRAILDNYLRKILLIPKLRGCPPLLAFLTPTFADKIETKDYVADGPPVTDGETKADYLDAAVLVPSAAGAVSSSAAAASSAGSSGTGDSGAATGAGLGLAGASDVSSAGTGSGSGSAGESKAAAVGDASAAATGGSEAPKTPAKVATAKRLDSADDFASPKPLGAGGFEHAFSPELDSKRGSVAGGRHDAEVKMPSRAWVSTDITDVSIPAAQILKKQHVVYQINCENAHRRRTYQRWTVLKRYVEFHRLHVTLRKTLKETAEGKVKGPDGETQSEEGRRRGAAVTALKAIPDLPGREVKMFTDHLNGRFIEKRRLILQCYLAKLITLPAVCAQPIFLDFLGCS